ncbi:MAG: PEP-CTERM sorting domain-containing protein [Verrucomicrobiota bacterium JB024]|nr:PEP-CTERM sorting domain-containing protein [Verrucomicrobiota bacterium JB024]
MVISRFYPAAILSLAVVSSIFTSHAQTTQIVFINNTGLPDDAIFVNMQGASSFANVTNGSGTGLNQNTSYSLKSLYGSVSGAGTGGPTGTVATISAGTFANGAVFYVTAGQDIGSSQPATNVVSGRFEAYIDGASTSNNIDSSYVSSISMPISYSVKQRSNGSLVTLTGQTNQVLTQGTSAFTNLTSSTTVTPLSARVNASYNVVNDAGKTIGTMSGIASIQSPQNNPDYHGWVGTYTGTRATSGFTSWMQNQGKTINVSNYTVPVNKALGGTEFGFVGSGGTSPFGANDPTSEFTQAQDYTLTATFEGDLNQSNDPNLAAKGITQGTSGVKLVGTGSVVGDITIYITNTQLDDPTGIYGANPTYVIVWDGMVVSTSNTNSLTDRIVGDLLTMINMGAGDSLTQIWDHALATSTTGNLANSIFENNNNAINTLSSGEFIYLLSLQDTATSDNLAQWFGEAIESNPDFYNTYASMLAQDTEAYTLSYSDRLAGEGSPDVFYTPVDATVPLEDLYLEIILEAGGYTYNAVPEPSQWAALAGALVLTVTLWRRRRARR